MWRQVYCKDYKKPYKILAILKLWHFFKKSAKTTEELFQNNEKIPLGFIEDEVENVRNVPENMDEDDHDENQEIFAFDENMHENGHDENQENEANQNVLNAIVQEEFLKQETDDNDEMNNSMIVEDSVDKLIPRNSNSFDLLNKDCLMTMKPVWRLEIWDLISTYHIALTILIFVMFTYFVTSNDLLWPCSEPSQSSPFWIWPLMHCNKFAGEYY